MFFFWLTGTTAFAKSSDIDQTLHIEADSVEIREQQGISIYKGHVNIRRGSMLIKGQLIHITNKDNEIYTIKIEGKPARFKQTNDNDQEISAQSQKMIFNSSTGILTMDNNAILIQGQNQFTSDHIIYNTKQDIVQAGKDNDNTADTDETAEPKRVSIIIQPKKDNTETQSSPQWIFFAQKILLKILVADVS